MHSHAGAWERGKKSGVPMAAVDGIIAATACTHHLTLVTRNVKDFAPGGIPVISPWTL